jgi:hypothetical protein
MTALFVVCLIMLLMLFALLVTSVERPKHDPGGGPRSPPPGQCLPCVFLCP